MNEEQLKAQIVAYKKGGPLRAGALLAILIGGPLSGTTIAMLNFPLVFLFVPLFLGCCMVEVRLRKLCCPFCRARLIGELGEEAIATGRCWKCKRLIFGQKTEAEAGGAS